MSALISSLRGRVALLGAAFLIAGLVWILVGTAAVAGGKTWTSDPDFDLGSLQAVNHDAPNNNQLQLNASGSTLPFMWIANAGEDTVSKIDTNTGKELARYRTWAAAGTHGAWGGPAPSRTAVDSDGNVYVANRHFDGNKPQVMKILLTGGIDRNGNGTIETSSDANSDGVISGAELLSLADANSNSKIDAAELQDERVAWAVQVGGAGQLGRSLCIGTDGNIWLGTYSDSNYYKISAADGSLLAGPYNISPDSPYGCLVDGSGRLWSASLSSYLGELNTSTGATVVHNHGAQGSDYGIAVGNGKVYQASQSSYVFIQHDPATDAFSTPAYPATSFGALGIAVDGNGDILVGPSNGGMCKFAPDGSNLWCSPAQPGTSHVRGVVVDGNNNAWAVHLNDNNISKFRGTDGAPLGVFPVGLSPYTYSDAAGLAALSTTTPTGFWTIVYDSGIAGNEWGSVIWNTEAPAGSNAGVPDGATLQIRVRSADDQADLDNQTYADVSNGVLFTAAGRYIQIQAKLIANVDGASPILYDLTVKDLKEEATPTATPAASPTAVAEVAQLPRTGGQPSRDPGILPQLLAISGAVVVVASAGSLVASYVRRRVR